MLPFLAWPERTCWNRRLPDLSTFPNGFPRAGPGAGLKGVEGLPKEKRDRRPPLPLWGGYVAELYGCFLQGVSGMAVIFAPGCLGGPSSGLRLIFDTRPVDMKADCSGLACLYWGVATGSASSLTGRCAPGGRDLEKLSGTRGLSPKWAKGTWVGESSGRLEPDEDCVNDRDSGWGWFEGRGMGCADGFGSGPWLKGLPRSSGGTY